MIDVRPASENDFEQWSRMRAALQLAGRFSPNQGRFTGLQEHR
jgi:hypothetical protein